MNNTIKKTMSDTNPSSIVIQKSLSPWKLTLAFSLICLFILIAYSNHFNNEFHFDDGHVVVSNIFIRNIQNIPLFFKDASTMSSLPTNQTYRPMLTTSLAFDYWIGGGLNPFWFHVTTFCWYLLQCILMYFFFIKIANASVVNRWNPYFSLLAVTWYGLHTANAETINYITSRSDSLSTCWLIISFIVFIRLPSWRRWGIYLLPFIVALLFKQTAIVFPALLSLYVLYFEEQAGLRSLFKRKTSFKLLYNTLKTTVSAWVIALVMFILLIKMLPATTNTGGDSVYHYIITQPFVLLHYFQTFFLPFQLSADTDWKTLPGISDIRFIIGMAFIFIMLFIAFITSNKNETRPISFGIFWFFIALLPTSTFIATNAVMNDHRLFFPFVGLLLAVAYSAYLLVLKNKAIFINSPALKWVLASSIFIILIAHAYGTHQRNKVWFNSDSLWRDVTIKSPENGRGLMNYGLAFMQKGHYDAAEQYFLRALQYVPRYSIVHINLGILKNAQGKKAEAETYYKNAIKYGGSNHIVLYYYGKFLKKNNRKKEAEIYLLKSIKSSPGYLPARHTLMDIYIEQEAWDKLEKQARKALDLAPSDKNNQQYLKKSIARKSQIDLMLDKISYEPTPENFLQLSLLYYKKNQYRQCIESCRKALALKPDYAEAYNNICVSFNRLKKFTEAEQACLNALALNPEYKLARNNLNQVRINKSR